MMKRFAAPMKIWMKITQSCMRKILIPNAELFVSEMIVNGLSIFTEQFGNRVGIIRILTYDDF